MLSNDDRLLWSFSNGLVEELDLWEKGYCTEEVDGNIGNSLKKEIVVDSLLFLKIGAFEFVKLSEFCFKNILNRTFYNLKNHNAHEI